MSADETKIRPIARWVLITLSASVVFFGVLASCNEPPGKNTAQTKTSSSKINYWNAEAKRILGKSDYGWHEGMDDIKACLFQNITEDNRTALLAKQEELDQAYWVKEGERLISMPLNSDTLGYINNALNHIKDADLRKKLLAAKDEIHNDIDILRDANKKTGAEREADYKAYEKRYKALKAVEKKFDSYGTNSYRWDMQERMIKKGFTKTDEGLCTNKSGRQTYEEWEGTYSDQGYTFSVHCRWESMDAGYHYWTVTVN